MNTWFEIRNLAKNSKKWTARIFDVIGGFGVSARDFVEQLDGVPADAEITLEINSPGGSVSEGWAMYNAIARRRAQVVARIEGQAGSMASIVMLAAREVTAAENASVFLHNPLTMVGGNARTLRQTADVLDKVGEQLLAVYVAKSGKPADEIRAVMDANDGKGSYLTAAEAKALGLVDTVFGALKVAACDPAAAAAALEAESIEAVAKSFGVEIAAAVPAVPAGMVRVENGATFADYGVAEIQALIAEREAARAESAAHLAQANTAGELLAAAHAEIATIRAELEAERQGLINEEATQAKLAAELAAATSAAAVLQAERDALQAQIAARDAAALAARAEAAVEAAVAAGRIRPEARDTWRAKFVADEASTAALLDSLRPATATVRGAAPVFNVAGAAGGLDADAAIVARWRSMPAGDARTAFFSQHSQTIRDFLGRKNAGA